MLNSKRRIEMFIIWYIRIKLNNKYLHILNTLIPKINLKSFPKFYVKIDTLVITNLYRKEKPITYFNSENETRHKSHLVESLRMQQYVTRMSARFVDVNFQPMAMYAPVMQMNISYWFHPLSRVLQEFFWQATCQLLDRFLRTIHK